MQISFKNEEKTQEKRKSSNPDKGKGLKLLSALPYRKSKEKEHMIVTISSPKRFCNICGRNCKCGKI